MDIPRILQKIRPGASWQIGDIYETLEWTDEVQKKPTLEEIEIGALVFEEDFKRERIAYKILSDPEYPMPYDMIKAMWLYLTTNDKSKIEFLSQKIEQINSKFNSKE